MQQLILAEGGFEIKLHTPYANQWMTTLNGVYTIWSGLNFIRCWTLKTETKAENLLMTVRIG
jgi:hypothetical protein